MFTLRTTELTLCAAALGAFGWGMTNFFQKPKGHSAGTRLVALLGMAFAAWHLWAIVASTTVRWRGLVAIGLYAGAIALFFWAVRSCRRRPMTAIFEPDVPRHLVREGPYRCIRHPFYTAYAIFWLAGWIASGSWIALASVVVMFTTYARAAAMEEAKFRASPLAAEYAEYSRRRR